jgi:hypothetical protein
MTANEWIGFAVGVTTLVGAVAIGVRHLVKYYLAELKPNGGSSMADSVNRIEHRIDFLTEEMINHLKEHNGN